MPIGSAVLTRALQKVGSWYSINIGSETFNTWGAGSITYTAFSGEGIIFTRGQVDVSLAWGVAAEADAVGLFTMDSLFPEGSKILVTHRGTNYETIGEPDVPTFSGNDLTKIIQLRRLVI